MFKKKKQLCIIAGGTYSEFHVSIAMTKFALQSFASAKDIDISVVIVEQDFSAIEIDTSKFASSIKTEDIFYILEKYPHIYRDYTLKKGSIATVLASAVESADVVLPLMQGPYGEDGVIQGFIKMFNKPMVSTDVLGSALCKDKETQKRILQSNDIPIVPFLSYTSHDYLNINYDHVVQKLSSNLILKPANFGSSFGIEHVQSSSEFSTALSKIFDLGEKVIIEKYIENIELEFYVSGFKDPKIHSYYQKKLTGKYIDYKTKYLTKVDLSDYAPPDYSKEKYQQLENLVIKSYKACQCDLYARVDLFTTPEGEVLVNEINTIPTIDNGNNSPFFRYIIDLAYERHNQQNKLNKLIT